MTKKSVLLLFFVIPSLAFAQNKVAHVDVNEIFSKMPDLKSVETQLASKSEIFNKSLKTMQDEYDAKVNEFKGMDTSTSAAILQDKQTEIMSLQNRIEEFVKKSQTEFDQERQKLLQPIQTKIMQAIKEVGDENNYTYTFDLSALLYVNPQAIDAGKQVKAKLGITD
jgi:outer membrane protein